MIRSAIYRCVGALAVACVLSLGLVACSPAQDQAIISDANTACHVASAAEQQAASLAAHNQNIVAGQTIICTGIAAAASVTPTPGLTPAPVPSPATAPSTAAPTLPIMTVSPPATPVT